MSAPTFDYDETIGAWRQEIKQAEANGKVYIDMNIYGCSRFHGFIKFYFLGDDEIATYIFAHGNDMGDECAAYVKRREDGVHISPQRDGTMLSHKNYAELLPIGFTDYGDSLERRFGYWTGKGHEKVGEPRP